MKKCGYYPGYCMEEGRCPIDVVGWPSPVVWEKLIQQGKECYSRAGTTHEWMMRILTSKRRRDWKVGNPYDVH